MKRWFKVLSPVLALAVVGLLGLVRQVRHAPVQGETGSAADALARRAMEAVNTAAWERTGAVQWTFSGRNDHVWDRVRGFDRVRSGDNEVLLRLADRTGVARRGGMTLTGEEGEAAKQKAWRQWVNDSFWLNPVAKMFDDGTTRELVMEDGKPTVLVRFSKGGVTPGDAYQWFLDEAGRPRAWRIWVSVLPIGGVEFTWEDWVQLDGGAWIATRHVAAGISERASIAHVRAAPSLSALVPGPDIFAELEAVPAPASAPASQPAR